MRTAYHHELLTYWAEKNRLAKIKRDKQLEARKQKDTEKKAIRYHYALDGNDRPYIVYDK